MSRMTLCVLTAAVLAVLSVGLMIGRYYVLGEEVKLPAGPGTWKVTLLVHGRTASDEARLTTAVPPDFGRQHVLHELYRSTEFVARPRDQKHPERPTVSWTLRPGVANAPFRARYEMYCAVDVRTPTTPMSKLARTLYAPPAHDAALQSEEGIESDHPELVSLARQLATGLEETPEELEALFHHVDAEIGNEPTVRGGGLTALECLRNGSGDSAAKSRLLAALCRSRGIPARLVSGVALRRANEQGTHVWVEAWFHDRWVPLCPFYHHYGRVPATYLVFGFGDQPLVRGRGVRDLSHAFLVERVPTGEGVADGSRLRQTLLRLSLFALPPTEQRLVEFLLLLPIAALIVCLFRNVIGLNSFGTFAPALVGLAFRDLGSLPGILVFVCLVLVGWLLRRLLDFYHLLQVPRMAFLLSLVVIVLITAIMAANYQDLPATRYISLFPMVILTAMIERFWTLEVEDSTASSFRTLLGTMAIAASISLFLSLNAVVRHMFRYPETLGLIMAAQLLIGRYTGYRLLELFRFRDFLRQEPALTAR